MAYLLKTSTKGLGHFSIGKRIEALRFGSLMLYFTLYEGANSNSKMMSRRSKEFSHLLLHCNPAL